MTNKEIFQQLSSVFEGVVNATMSTKKANAITKSSGEDLKRLKKELREFNRCSKIAASRNEKIVEAKNGSFNVYGIPTDKKEYYFKKHTVPEEKFNIDGLECIVIFKSDEHEF